MGRRQPMRRAATGDFADPVLDHGQQRRAAQQGVRADSQKRSARPKRWRSQLNAPTLAPTRPLSPCGDTNGRQYNQRESVIPAGVTQ